MKKRKHPSELPFNLFTVDAPTGNRLPRLEHLLSEEISRLFRLEVSDPRLQHLVIVAVQLSPDMKNVRISYAVQPNAETAIGDKQILEGLSRVTPFLRARVAEALSFKRVPNLNFHRDRLAESSLRADQILTKSS